jgi:hypothetical protein
VTPGESWKSNSAAETPLLSDIEQEGADHSLASEAFWPTGAPENVLALDKNRRPCLILEHNPPETFCYLIPDMAVKLLSPFR